MNKLLWRITRRMVIALAFLCLISAVLIYAFGMLQRSNSKNTHTESSTADGGIYTAKYGSAGAGYQTLRLYRSSDLKLLAESTFYEPDLVTLYWEKNLLIYTDPQNDAYFHNGEMKLPPTWGDRMLAMLP